MKARHQRRLKDAQPLAIVLAVYMALGLPQAALACDPCLLDPCGEGCCVSDLCTTRWCDAGECVSLTYCQSASCCPPSPDGCVFYSCNLGVCEITGECMNDDCCKEVPDDPWTINLCGADGMCGDPIYICAGPGEGACCDTAACCDDGQYCTDDICGEDHKCHYVSKVDVEVSSSTGILYHGPVITPLGQVLDWNLLALQAFEYQDEIDRIRQQAVAESRNLTQAEIDRLTQLASYMQGILNQCMTFTFPYDPPMSRFFVPAEGIEIRIVGPSNYTVTIVQSDSLSSTASFGNRVATVSSLAGDPPQWTGHPPKTLTVRPTGNYGTVTLDVSWTCPGGDSGSKPVTVSVQGEYEEALCIVEAMRYNNVLSCLTAINDLMNILGYGAIAQGLALAPFPGCQPVAAALGVIGGLFFVVGNIVYNRGKTQLDAQHRAAVAVIEECPEHDPVGEAENNICQ